MQMLRAVALAAVVGALATADAAAQLPVIGFRLGASLSKASTELTDFGDFNDKSLTQFVGGGFVRFGFGLLGVQPEVMYVTKGIKFEGATPDDEASLRFDYIEVPVLLHLQFPAVTIAPYLVAGPAFAFEVSCTVEGTDGSVTVEFDCDDSDQGQIDRKKLDVGAMFGAGLAFPAGPGSLVLDGRYNLGLINIVDDESDDSFKHRTFYITAGYEIPLGLR